MARLFRTVAAACAALSLLVCPVLADFPVVMGNSWDGISLQEILDAEYGLGVIDVATDYEGYLPGDADPPYWEDSGIGGLIVRELAGFANHNVMGWYVETFSMPVIDGTDDGVIVEGASNEGDIISVSIPGGVQRFGFYLNPNGVGNSNNAPEPETFFTNRSYNDVGPNGAGTIHVPDGGDPQCLIFNITELRGGTPTYVLAWEDIDSGSELSDVFGSSFTDNDFNDLVVEITADSPVRTEVSSFGGIKALYGN